MKRLIQQRYVVRQNILGIICLCLSLYFTYHLIGGERSYLRLMSLRHQIDTTQVAYTQTKEKREATEQKVVMMRPGSIDPDLLEEQARSILGYRRADEKIILMN